MPQKTLATIGLLVFVAAICVLWGTNHWVQTRTFDPVDMPVSLQQGQIRTGAFEINLSESYEVFIHFDPSLDDYYAEGRCSYKNLGSDRWRVFRLVRGSSTERQLWASYNNSDDSLRANQFEAVPGRYEVEWDVPAGAACLNIRHPRLHVSTYADEYLKFAALTQYPCLFIDRCDACVPCIVYMACPNVFEKAATANISRACTEKCHCPSTASTNTSDKGYVQFWSRVGQHSLCTDVFVCDEYAGALFWFAT